MKGAIEDLVTPGLNHCLPIPKKLEKSRITHPITYLRLCIYNRSQWEIMSGEREREEQMQAMQGRFTRRLEIKTVYYYKERRADKKSKKDASFLVSRTWSSTLSLIHCVMWCKGTTNSLAHHIIKPDRSEILLCRMQKCGLCITVILCVCVCMCIKPRIQPSRCEGLLWWFLFFFFFYSTYTFYATRRIIYSRPRENACI